MPLFFLCALAFLYLSFFRLPSTPVFGAGDGYFYLLDATRMLDGEIIYRDFFEFLTPGLPLVNLGFFKLFGVRNWIPNVAVITVVLGLTLLIVAISRKVLSGGAIFLPSALFLTLAGPRLDNTHHWYSALAELGAVAVVIERRTWTRLVVAGILCGLASFFTQTQGVLAVAGLAIFLLWEGSRAGQGRLEIFRHVRYLFVPFVATVFATNAYFVWKAGLDRFLHCTVMFVLKYWSSGWESDSIYAPLFEFRQLFHWRELPALGLFCFIHALLPVVYVWFWMRCRREALPREQGTRLALLGIVGSFLAAGVASAPTTYRMLAVAPLGVILLVRLIHGGSKLARTLNIALGVIAACIAIAHPLHVQSQEMLLLDLPRGRMALDPTYYEKLLWLSQQTVPGEFLFTAAGAEVLYPLALRDPAEVFYVETTDYTRPEQVREAVASLERNRVRFILSDPSLHLESNWHPKTEHVGLLRSFLRARLRGNDHLGPLRNYLHARYHVARRFVDSSEIWERNQ